MIELIEANWLLILLAVLVGFVVAWFLLSGSRKTRITREDTPQDTGTKRNQALIDAPSGAAKDPPPADPAPAPAASPAPSPVPTPRAEPAASATAAPPPAPAPKAEPAADRLANLVPGSGHLVHMPSHIYFRVGRYQDSALANIRAAEVDEAYIAQCSLFNSIFS